MRRRLYLSLFALFLLLLSGCGEGPGPETRILVSIRESAGFTVENNGQYIQPGEDAVFLLNIDSGFTLADADYAGDYRAAVDGRHIELTLKNVQYPTQVALRLTSRYAAVTYEPNGGTGEAATVAYDTTVHLRPNTSNGAGLFSREGYTLIGWDTRADGTGERVGLGSRVSVDIRLTLYAQWARWSDAADFICAPDGDRVAVTGYRGSDDRVVIPAAIDGREVTAIAAGAFRDCAMTEVILPATMKTVEDGAFQDCALESLTLFDNIESIGDGAFTGCGQLRTLHINAVERPYGANYRKESCYPDKVDLLIQARGEKKIVFYGGCSVWYNLDGSMLSPLLDQGYRVVNLGLNGTVNSSVQMQILGNYLEDGDILFHTPELSSPRQMLTILHMNEADTVLWCGLEYNYDLFALVDLRTVPGALDSFCGYLSKKESRTDYNAVYTEDYYKTFCDEYGCIPFYRTDTKEDLADRVFLDPDAIDGGGMARLKAFYDWYRARGVRVYLSYACVNMDGVPEEQRGNVELMDRLFREAVGEMDGPVLISRLEDFLYHRDDFYDTNYHLLSRPARENTSLWLRDLRAQMERDGLWDGAPPESGSDPETYKALVSQCRAAIREAGAVLTAVGLCEHLYWEACEATNVYDTDGAVIMAAAFEWLAAETDETRETAAAAYDSIRQQFGIIGSIQPEGAQAAEIAKALRSMYGAYISMYSLIGSPAGCRISFENMINDYTQRIAGCDAALALLLD